MPKRNSRIRKRERERKEREELAKFGRDAKILAGGKKKIPAPLLVREPLHDTAKDLLSIVSWNVLSEFNRKRHAYPHVKNPAIIEWEKGRGEAVCRFLRTTNADVMCLQEVDQDLFEKNLRPFFSSIGYDSAIRSGEKRVSAWETAIVWRKSKFRVKFQEHRGSRTFSIGLAEKNEKKVKASDDDGEEEEKEEDGDATWVICSVHLEGHPSKGLARVKQLHKMLLRLSRDYACNSDTMRLVVAGDFNSGANNDAPVFLSRGSLPAKGCVAFDGRTVVRTDARHGWRMGSALQSFEGGPTYLCLPSKYSDAAKRRAVDHIFFCTKTLDLVSVRLPLSFVPNELKHFSRTGLPSRSNPSDHFAIGATFRAKSPLSCSKKDVASKGVFGEKERLPLTSSQLASLNWLIETEPTPTSRGRPSSEWIALAQVHRRRIRNIALSNELKSIRQKRWFKAHCKRMRALVKKRRNFDATKQRDSRSKEGIIAPKASPKLVRARSAEWEEPSLASEFASGLIMRRHQLGNGGRGLLYGALFSSDSPPCAPPTGAFPRGGSKARQRRSKLIQCPVSIGRLRSAPPRL